MHYVSGIVPCVPASLPASLRRGCAIARLEKGVPKGRGVELPGPRNNHHRPDSGTQFPNRKLGERRKQNGNERTNERASEPSPRASCRASSARRVADIFGIPIPGHSAASRPPPGAEKGVTESSRFSKPTRRRLSLPSYAPYVRSLSLSLSLSRAFSLSLCAPTTTMVQCCTSVHRQQHDFQTLRAIDRKKGEKKTSTTKQTPVLRFRFFWGHRHIWRTSVFSPQRLDVCVCVCVCEIRKRTVRDLRDRQESSVIARRHNFHKYRPA